MTQVPGVNVMVLRQLLRRHRQDRGLTQAGLARHANISERTVSDLERGVYLTARAATARQLADALGLAGADRNEFMEAAATGHTADHAAETRNRTAAVWTLPRDVADFTGRVHDLKLLTRTLPEEPAGAVLAIHAVDGMAGVGKTAFMVHAAHWLADRFPDGQIFVPLHAHAPGTPAVEPGDALATLLVDDGMAPGQIPEDAQARADLWRSRTAGRKMLMLLDDAESSEQVRPLLPSAPGTLVFITSRRQLTGLDGVVPISLAVLPPEEAAELFVRVAARAELGPTDTAVKQIAGLCGYLPLAIRMIAVRLAGHPNRSLEGLTRELMASGRLAALYNENLSVATAFELSYRDLDPEQQRLFRLLGANPGTDIDAYGAAALLASWTTGQAWRLSSTASATCCARSRSTSAPPRRSKRLFGCTVS